VKNLQSRACTCSDWKPFFIREAGFYACACKCKNSSVAAKCFSSAKMVRLHQKLKGRMGTFRFCPENERPSDAVRAIKTFSFAYILTVVVFSLLPKTPFCCVLLLTLTFHPASGSQHTYANSLFHLESEGESVLPFDKMLRDDLPSRPSIMERKEEDTVPSLSKFLYRCLRHSFKHKGIYHLIHSQPWYSS